MELRHLEYFVAVAEELSFTRAAERLTIAQSPVSQQIRKLERELGTALFDRTTRSVELTEAGRILYAEAIALLAASRRAADNARLAGQGHLGRLALAFTGSATYELMPLLVRAYTQRFPNVTLEVRSEMLTPAQVGGLLEGSITVGLLRPPVAADGLVVEILRHEPLVALPQLTALLGLPGRHQRLPSGRILPARPPGGRRDLQPRRPGGRRARSGAGAGFGPASPHQRSHPPAAPRTSPGHRAARRRLPEGPGLTAGPRLPRDHPRRPEKPEATLTRPVVQARRTVPSRQHLMPAAP